MKQYDWVVSVLKGTDKMPTQAVAAWAVLYNRWTRGNEHHADVYNELAEGIVWW